MYPIFELSDRPDIVARKRAKAIGPLTQSPEPTIVAHISYVYDVINRKVQLVRLSTIVVVHNSIPAKY